MRVRALVLIIFLAASTYAKENNSECNSVENNVNSVHCASLELEKAKKQLHDYLDASFEYNHDNDRLIESIQAAQFEWERYVVVHCNSVYDLSIKESMSSLSHYACKTNLTNKRTYEVWVSFLTNPSDNTPYVPKPKI